MDNIRSNSYTKNLCQSKKIDGLLISLDAKTAFDSVSHDYIRENTVLGKNLLNSLIRCIMASQLKFWLIVYLVKRLLLKGE